MKMALLTQFVELNVLSTFLSQKQNVTGISNAIKNNSRIIQLSLFSAFDIYLPCFCFSVSCLLLSYPFIFLL
uniref:Uncharacterized protein n=1 Tax=Rhizophora mucronata TaxID=61149 RepID=A0A2P2J5N8_RHIMU